MADPNTTPQDRIYNQIETDAAYNPPSVYDILTRFDSFQTVDDADALNWIPLTTATQGRGDQTGILPFVVGLIPPATKITGKLLDRSATVGAIQGAAQQLGFGPDAAPYDGGSTTAPPDAAFWSKYVAMCNRLGVDPKELAKVLNCESGLNPAAVAWRNDKNLPCHEGDGEGCHPLAKGLNQLVHSTAVPSLMDEATWNIYETLPRDQQLVYVEKFMHAAGVKGKDASYIYGKNFGGYNSTNPTGSDGVSINYASQAYMDANGGRAAWPNYDGNRKAFLANPGLDGGKGYITTADLGASVDKHPLPNSFDAGIDAAKAQLDSGGAPPPVAAPPPNDGVAWQGGGVQNAKDSKKQQGKFANKDLNTSELGKNLLAAQSAQINATNQAIQAMAKVPPLQMLVNPTTFKFSSEKILSDGNWGRSGPVIQMWGHQQEKIEGSGKLAAFYAIDKSDSVNGSPGNGPGLTRTARTFSMSYQNFLSLYLIYKSNGGIWLDDYYSNAHSNTKRLNLTLVGSVYIYYDNTMYVGSFDNFSITEADTAPYTLEYNFSFTVRAWFLLDRKADPRFNYGSPAAKPSTGNDIPTQSTANPSPEAIQDQGGGDIPWQITNPLPTDPKEQQAEAAKLIAAAEAGTASPEDLARLHEYKLTFGVTG
jgi:hypothetical protein